MSQRTRGVKSKDSHMGKQRDMTSDFLKNNLIVSKSTKYSYLLSD